MHHVARNLDVHRPLVALARGEHAIDFTKCRGGVGELGHGDAQFFEHVVLRAQVAHHVVQQGVVLPLAEAGGTGNHHHRRLFRIRPRDAVAHAQSAHAVRHAQGAHAVDPRVGVRRKAGAIFPRAADRFEVALFEQRVEAEHIVARDAEHMPHAVIGKPLNEILANRRMRFGHVASWG